MSGPIAAAAAGTSRSGLASAPAISRLIPPHSFPAKTGIWWEGSECRGIGREGEVVVGVVGGGLKLSGLLRTEKKGVPLQKQRELSWAEKKLT